MVPTYNAYRKRCSLHAERQLFQFLEDSDPLAVSKFLSLVAQQGLFDPISFDDYPEVNKTASLNQLSEASRRIAELRAQADEEGLPFDSDDVSMDGTLNPVMMQHYRSLVLDAVAALPRFEVSAFWVSLLNRGLVTYNFDSHRRHLLDIQHASVRLAYVDEVQRLSEKMYSRRPSLPSDADSVCTDCVPVDLSTVMRLLVDSDEQPPPKKFKRPINTQVALEAIRKERESNRVTIDLTNEPDSPTYGIPEVYDLVSDDDI